MTLMSADRDTILGNLHAVESERRRRSEHPELARKVVALKAFQQRRFARSYADLLASERYRPACRFFLEELYGPKDFTHRDEQFAKIVTGLVAFFPREVIVAVASVAELHALSEVLDTAMAVELRDAQIASVDYVRAWQGVGRRADRHRQVALTVGVAQTLDRVTRKPLMRSAVRVMRAPARAAGVTELQRFVEAGFEAFAAMRGARDFIATVESREEAFAAAIFAAAATDAAASTAGVLAALA
jgi:hypothetical protein